LAFSLNTCAYQLEMFAGAIRNTPHGEVEAAKAMGMTRSTALRSIILPSALRRALIPPFSNEVILMLQGSAIASAVTLVDLTGAARNVYSRHYAPFEAFVFAGLLYLVVTFVLVGLFRSLKTAGWPTCNRAAAASSATLPTWRRFAAARGDMPGAAKD
jgi:arginine/ornithine transport system permease protein